MAFAYIGLGSNLGDPVKQLQQAVTALSELASTEIQQCSSLYRTAPIGYAQQPDFINAVCLLSSGLAPLQLLKHMQAIEQNQGRLRSDNRNAARTLDLDLLLYDQQVILEPELAVPHARLHQRAFVLYPLFELDPELRIPGHGSVSELKNSCSGQRIERLQQVLDINREC